MPAAEDNRQFRTQTADHQTHIDCVADHGAGQKRYAKTQGVLNLVLDDASKIAMKGTIDDSRFVTCFAEGSGEAQKSERRPKKFAAIRRRKQNDPARLCQHVTTSVSSRCASTFVLGGCDIRSSAFLAHNSMGN